MIFMYFFLSIDLPDGNVCGPFVFSDFVTMDSCLDSVSESLAAFGTGLGA